MSLPTRLDALTLQKLMAFADGELEGTDRTEIAALIDSNPDAARVVIEMGVLGDCVRVLGEARPVDRAETPGASIAHVVMATIASDDTKISKKIAGPRTGRTQGAQVIDFAARRRRTYGIVAGLIAAAAAVVIVARGPSTDPGEGPAANVAPPPAPPPATVVATAASPAASSAAFAVAVADSTEKPSVSVIVVPSEGETAPSVVIWLGEEQAVK